MNPKKTDPPSRIPFVVASVLFIGWISFLATLAFTARLRVVVSRPQVLVSDLVVLARVDSLEKPITVVEVLGTPWGAVAPGAGSTFEVINLADFKDSWTGSGRYLLALSAVADGKYRVTAVPRNPGYEGAPPRLYPATTQTLDQARQILAR